MKLTNHYFIKNAVNILVLIKVIMIVNGKYLTCVKNIRDDFKICCKKRQLNSKFQNRRLKMKEKST